MFLLYGPHADDTTCRTVVLQRNWRSHGAIIAWSNRYLYGDVVRDYGNAYITYHLVHSAALPKKGFPIVFHAIKGSEQCTESSPSHFDVLEASIVRNYCVKLVRDPQRKICGCKTFVVPPTLCLTRRRSRGNRRSRTLQNAGQGHPGVIEGGKAIRYFGWTCRAVSGTGLDQIFDRLSRH